MVSLDEVTTVRSQQILGEFLGYATSRNRRKMGSLLAQAEAEYRGLEGSDKDVWKERLDGMRAIQSVYFANEAALDMDYADQILKCLEGQPYNTELVPEVCGIPEGRVFAYSEARMALDLSSGYARQAPTDQQPSLQGQILGLEERLTKLQEATPQ